MICPECGLDHEEGSPCLAGEEEPTPQLEFIPLAEVADAEAFQALALRRYGGDFLSGNCEVFKDFDSLIKARVAQDPQKLTIHLPEGTPQAEVEGWVAQARTVDPRVPVEVHVYRRPPPSKAPPKLRRKPSGGASE